jgi:hypothetical protein
MSMSNLRPYCLLLAGLLSITCRRAEDPPRLFERLAPSATGVTFANRLPEDSSLNILNFLSYYNRGGVVAGDVNGDGLPDLYFVVAADFERRWAHRSADGRRLLRELAHAGQVRRQLWTAPPRLERRSFRPRGHGAKRRSPAGAGAPHATRSHGRWAGDRRRSQRRSPAHTPTTSPYVSVTICCVATWLTNSGAAVTLSLSGSWVGSRLDAIVRHGRSDLSHA